MIYFIQFLINTKLKCNFPRGILASCSGTQQIFKRMAQNEPEGASLYKKFRAHEIFSLPLSLSTEIDVSTEMKKKYEIPFFFFLIPYLKIIGRIEQTSGLCLLKHARKCVISNS